MLNDKGLGNGSFIGFYDANIGRFHRTLY